MTKIEFAIFILIYQLQLKLFSFLIDNWKLKKKFNCLSKLGSDRNHISSLSFIYIVLYFIFYAFCSFLFALVIYIFFHFPFSSSTLPNPPDTHTPEFLWTRFQFFLFLYVKKFTIQMQMFHLSIVVILIAKRTIQLIRGNNNK